MDENNFWGIFEQFIYTVSTVDMGDNVVDYIGLQFLGLTP